MRSVGSSEPLGPVQPVRPPRPADAPEEDPHDGQRRPDTGADDEQDSERDGRESSQEERRPTYGPSADAGRRQDGDAGKHVDEYA
jgi:hypothetical protein